jgi:hypothetical protein
VTIQRRISLPYAIGVTEKHIFGSLRIELGRDTVGRKILRLWALATVE